MPFLIVLDLTDKRDVQFKSLSGGQKQRVSITLALVGNPKAAILDELSRGLDPQARRTTWEVVRRERDAGAPWIQIGTMIAWTAVLAPLAVKLFKWR